MDSRTLLLEIRRQLDQGLVDAADIRRLLDESAPANGPSVSSRLSSILYYVGGGVVFMGLIVLIGQEWSGFGPVMKILVTLGSGIAAFVSGVLLDRRPGALGAAFFLISALIMPFGLGTLFQENGLHLSSAGVTTQIAALLTAVYVSAWWAFRRKILLLAGLVFATCLFFLLSDWMVMAAPALATSDFQSYRFLVLGISYVCLGHGMSLQVCGPLRGWLYGLGVAAVLGAALALGGWKPNQNWLWEAIYPGLVFAVLYLSIHLQSRTFLLFGALGLACYLGKMTAQYFSDSLGWPLALVLMGFLLMGVAYMALSIRNRFLQSP